jgi:hypothetical protein
MPGEYIQLHQQWKQCPSRLAAYNQGLLTMLPEEADEDCKFESKWAKSLEAMGVT